MMAGIKRSHDTTLVGDGKSSSYPETAYAKPRSVQPDGDVDSRLYKKSKRSPAASDTSNEMPKMPDKYVRFERCSISAQADEAASDATLWMEDEDMSEAALEAENADMREAALVPEDGDMSDVTLKMEDEDDHPSQQRAASDPSTTAAIPHGQPVQFVPHAPLLACDVANNFAPTDANIQQIYLNEVGQKQLHPLRTPLDTPNSAVPVQVRHVIYERLFLGMSNGDCMPSYNKHGGRANGPASVSKVFLPGACKWFEEQNVVLPWLGRKDSDKKRLAAIGLALENFPSPHATRTATGALKKASTVTKMQKPKLKPVIVKQAADKPAVDEGFGTVGYNDSQDLQDDEASKSEYEEPTERMWDHHKHRNIPNSKVLCDKGECEKPDIHVLTKAAMNAFDVEEDSTKALIVDGRRYMVKKKALFEHCGFVRSAVDDAEGCPSLKLHERDPAIARAFIQSISPYPGHELPNYDIEFARTTSFHRYDGTDPVGVLGEDNMRYCKIFWDIEACKDMYSLASALDCPIVKDMAIDRVIIMWKEERVQKESHPQDHVDEFALPLEFLNTLTLEKDAKFITTICEIYWGRLPLEERGKWPKVLSTEIVDHVNHVFAGHGSRKNGPRNVLKEHCARHHIHAESEPCHSIAGREHLAQTEDMIAAIFAVLRSEAHEKNYKDMEQLRAEKPDDVQVQRILQLESELVQTSLMQEECIANVDFKIEMLEVRMYHPNSSEDDKNNDWERREALVKRRNALQDEYYRNWDDVSARLKKMREAKQLENQNKAGIVISL
jgi:hypothetical protein